MSLIPNNPDPDIVRYEATMEVVHTAIGNLRKAGHLTDDDISYLFDNEPESHVYPAVSEDYDPDPDEYREIVMEVGARDLADKVRYWENILANWRENYGN